MRKQSNKVFVDTNFWIALLNTSDSLHQRAIATITKIRRESPLLFISNFIFLETVTVAAQRISKKAALFIGEQLLKDDQVSIIHVNQRIHLRTWEIFSRVKRKNISFVDCSILAIMEQEEIPYLLTFDRKDFYPLKRQYQFEFF